MAVAELSPATSLEQQLLKGIMPEDVRYDGHLNLRGSLIERLPDGLEARSLDLSGCYNLRELPRGLKVRRLIVSGCVKLEKLPDGLTCYELEARNTGLTELPADLRVEYRLDLTNNAKLHSLPYGLKTGSLILRDCVSLTELPEDLDVCFLDISGCLSFRRFPMRAKVRAGRLVAQNCPNLTYLPSWLTNIAQLDVRGCPNLTELPEQLQISSWLDLAGTGVEKLPRSLWGVPLRWRGILVDSRFVFHPETITSREVLEEPNTERRRILLERMGYERFLGDVKARQLDCDTDPGGERRLLRVEIPNDEPLVCLAVFCPSTARQYLLRVPPTMQSCHQAAAWIAGFDNPDDYKPVKET
jgi:hypothetical protein